MNVCVGTAPDSWGVWFPGEAEQTPWHRFLDEVVEAGYRWIELGPYGYLPSDPAALRTELEQRGLKIASGWVMEPLEAADSWESLKETVQRTAELLVGVGAPYLILIDDVYIDLTTAKRTSPSELAEDEWRRLIENSQRIAQLAGRFGLRTVFHPHAESHIEYEYQIERFLDETDLDLCFDIGHHAYCGSDPLDFIKRHHDRIPYLHLKSVDSKVLRIVRERALPFATAVEMDVFVEPAEGSVDFRALCALLDEIDYEGFAIVEQDMRRPALDKPLPIAKRTRALLRSIGIG